MGNKESLHQTIVVLVSGLSIDMTFFVMLLWNVNILPCAYYAKIVKLFGLIVYSLLVLNQNIKQFTLT